MSPRNRVSALPCCQYAEIHGPSRRQKAMETCSTYAMVPQMVRTPIAANRNRLWLPYKTTSTWAIYCVGSCRGFVGIKLKSGRFDHAVIVYRMAQLRSREVENTTNPGIHLRAVLLCSSILFLTCLTDWLWEGSESLGMYIHNLRTSLVSDSHNRNHECTRGEREHIV